MRIQLPTLHFCTVLIVRRATPSTSKQTDMYSISKSDTSAKECQINIIWQKKPKRVSHGPLLPLYTYSGRFQDLIWVVTSESAPAGRVLQPTAQ